MNALARSLNLKAYLRENRLATGIPLEVTWIPEDWDSIAALTRQSGMMFREAALDLIGSVDMDKGRERMLMKLADGKPYRYLAGKDISRSYAGRLQDRVHPPGSRIGGEA